MDKTFVEWDDHHCKPKAPIWNGYHMEKDPTRIKQLAIERDRDNWNFFRVLKHSPRFSEAKVDSVAEQAGKAAEREMDCTTCGECCRDISVPVIEEEIGRLAKRLGITAQEFRTRYVVYDESECEDFIEAHPCPFLADGKCSVYDDRPQACRDYPYIGGSISHRTYAIMDRLRTCPIVFEMIERLKMELGWRRRSDR